MFFVSGLEEETARVRENARSLHACVHRARRPHDKCIRGGRRAANEGQYLHTYAFVSALKDPPTAARNYNAAAVPLGQKSIFLPSSVIDCPAWNHCDPTRRPPAISDRYLRTGCMFDMAKLPAAKP